MKRIGFLYEKVADLENLKLAIKNSAKGKRRHSYVMRIQKDPDKYAAILREMLLSKDYRLGFNRYKVIHDNSCGKDRQITIPKYFPDQVLHWAIMQVLQPVIMRGMYRYCCGSVPHRGGMAVKKKIESILKKDKKIRYIMKLDIHKFFPSINHDRLMELLATKIKDREMLGLLKAVIDHGGAGLPIGYYTSQWLSNFYLEPLDHFVKEGLKARYYIRYVDDMVIFGTNKRELRKMKARLDEFLAGFSLSLKDNWQIWKIDSRPLDFVGYRYTRDRTTVRKKIFFRMMRTVRRVKKNGLNIVYARKLNSLLGWFSHIYFKNYYSKNIAPIVTKKAVRRYISKYDRRVRDGAA